MPQLPPPLSGLISDSGLRYLVLFYLELLKLCPVALTILKQETKFDSRKLAMEKMSGWKWDNGEDKGNLGEGTEARQEEEGVWGMAD